MAVDSRDKRASAIHVGLPWRGLEPLPDGTISTADRQHIAWIYRGIAAEESEGPLGIADFVAPTIRPDYVARTRQPHFTAPYNTPGFSPR